MMLVYFTFKISYQKTRRVVDRYRCFGSYQTKKTKRNMYTNEKGFVRERICPEISIYHIILLVTEFG